MIRQEGAVHVARVVRKHQKKDGEDRQSISHLLRRIFCQEGKIRHETLGNVSALPAADGDPSFVGALVIDPVEEWPCPSRDR